MRVLPVAIGLAFFAAAASAQTMTPEAGVPLEVATRRAAAVSNLRYDLSLSIPDTLASPLTGSTTIRFDLKDASAPLVLDFETSRDHIRSVDANGKPVPINYVNGHIVIPAAALAAGANSIRIAFNAGDASLNRNNDFLYTLFVPARARLAFPVFDQPDLKGRWTVTLEHPAKWQSAANGAETSRTTTGDRTTVKFMETQPLPTYLVAFIAGDFKVETAERNGRTFRMFHRETDAAKVARNRDAIFDLHARALEFLERYTSIPYAFGKFDFVAVPAFQFGGMEHAGKILYNASGLMLDESATQNQLLGRASVISHETAHMWFGDLVTMRWFNDVWMKEVFANFMAAKIVNPSFPNVNHDLRFLLSNYPSAYEVDRTPGANPIRQVLDNLNEAGSMYGAIIYQKAPIVMRHLEALLGEDNFRDGLREYLKAHAFANATWPDLIDVLDRRTPLDLQQWSRSWVDMPGRPSIETILETKNGTITRLAFRQKDTWNRNLIWPQQLRVAIGGHAPEKIVNVEMTGREVEVKEAAGWPAPRYVLPNGKGWGYGDFALDKTTLAYLMANLPDIADPLTRGSAWVALWDALLDGEVKPDAFLDLTFRSLPRETDEQLTSRVLGYASNTWWRFLGQPQRMTRAARFESLLREGLAQAGTPSQKASWFGALRNNALTPATVNWLRQVWEKKENVNGLPLAEADYTSLALELAVRQVDGWSEILKTQLSRIENPDRRGRFQFVMPSLSADPAEREKWFLSLRDVNNRRREPWVLEGLSYLHHPLRAEASKKYVQPSLEMLWEIQKTGDIFFPKRWLDSTLGGHQTKEAAEIVRAFLKNLPANYPERLRNITLQSADELYRAAEVVKK
ncbi:MAG: ERAP1-like C-terminal domain-containing protein [Cyanobacteria bacterium]|nr:ERAP1-like C-terminal domain-containing protein [Cyanobacteriota bacterium]